MRLARLAVLWAALVALSAAPALAQDAIAIGGGDATGGNVQYVDCSQVQIAVQGQYGNANALGNRAVAAIANEQNITQDQVNACLGEPGQNGGGNNNGGDDNGGDDNDTNGDGVINCEDFDSEDDAQTALDADDDLTGLDEDNDGEACEDFNFTADDDAVAAAEDDVVQSSIPKVASLPNTGGPSLPAVGLGVALVAAGASLIGFSVRR